MNTEAYPIAKFRLGHIVTSANALSQLTPEDILMGIQRHQAGDWGDVNEADREANDLALIEGTRLWSVYHAASGVEFQIITEANRSVTTVLLPEDY